jgi:hypothetical protein
MLTTLKGTGAVSYIKHGEQLNIHIGKTYKGKAAWYKFDARKAADLIVPCGIGDRIYCSLNTAHAISSNSFTEIRLKDKKYSEIIWLFFNSAFGWLLIELHGRSSMGGGMLKVDPTDIRKMQVISPGQFKKSMLPEVKDILKRPVGTVEEESVAKDRKKNRRLYPWGYIGSISSRARSSSRGG